MLKIACKYFNDVSYTETETRLEALCYIYGATTQVFPCTEIDTCLLEIFQMPKMLHNTDVRQLVFSDETTVTLERQPLLSLLLCREASSS